ncbi:MAG: GNAT family N-acetyltransferase [Candidatus Lokiarchaeota archaeon]|nr:GNAT family N-acetyltransferase [Candidatus Lokiarchaeota archaeon]MBD3200879.1 GNAT family N-acetyltransferase [Candidatus Lokiarchaeota archaeon]
MPDKKEEIEKEQDEEQIYTFIEGETIDLTPTNSNHIELYAKWSNSEEIRKYARNEMPRTIEDIKKRFEQRGGDGPKEHIGFEIWHKEDKKLIGLGGLNHIHWVNGTANLFMQIGEKDYWSHGIGTEAAKIIVDYGFKELNLHKIFAGVLSKNVGSWTCAEKVGFIQEATLKDEVYVDGEYIDVKKYYILKENWLHKNK